MYEKEIKGLEALKRFVGYCEPGAIDTAIELMRAASVAPHDEAAEREHCVRAVSKHFEQPLESAYELLLRERGSVRAECAAEIDKQQARAISAEMLLAGAEGKIERLKSEFERYKRQRLEASLEANIEEQVEISARAQARHDQLELMISARDAEIRDWKLVNLSTLETELLAKIEVLQADIAELRNELGHT